MGGTGGSSAFHTQGGSGNVSAGGGGGGQYAWAHAYPEYQQAIISKRRDVIAASMEALGDWLRHPQMVNTPEITGYLDNAARELVKELDAKPRCVTCGQEKPDEADA